MSDCSHNIIEDYIDIDPDRSKQIFYCTLCLTSFCHKEVHANKSQHIILYDTYHKESKQENHQY
jgi:hypothetical protein